MSRIILNTKIWLFVLLFGMSFPAWAQSDDFNTWTKFKVNYKICLLYTSDAADD